MSLIQWIDHSGPGKLGVMAKPGRQDQLEDDLREAQVDGMDELICLMTPDEMDGSEREVAEKVGIKFRSFPIPDHGTPTADVGTMDFLDARLHELKQGKGVVFHCNSGRGRTTLMAASLLVMQGMDPDDAIQHVRGRRLVPVPDSKEQTEWVRQLARNLGHLVKADQPTEARPAGYLKYAIAAGAAVLAAVGIWQWRKRAG